MTRYFFFFLFISHFSLAQDIEWSFIGDKSEYKYITKTQVQKAGFISFPFDTTYVLPFWLFDSMINHSKQYEKAYERFVMNRKNKPIPLSEKFTNKLIVYKNRKMFTYKRKKLSIYSFILSKGESFNEDDCYVGYYIKDIGFVLVIDEVNTTPSSYWNSYSIKKTCHTISDSEELDFFVKQADAFSKETY